jgi:hypothetical protein
MRTKKTTVDAVDQEIRHQLVIVDQLSSPAREQHIEDMRSRAYKLTENVCVLASELRDLLDQLDGAAPKVDTRSLVGRLRTAEGELDAAVVCLAGELGLVAVAE